MATYSEYMDMARKAHEAGNKDHARRLVELARSAKSEGTIHATLGDGAVYKAADGSLSFKSPGYSTNDPEIIAKLLEGDSVKSVVQSSVDKDVIGQHPIMARVIKSQELPFVGSYIDDFVEPFSDKAANAIRVTSKAMDREKPVQSAALQVAGTLGTVAAGGKIASKLLGSSLSPLQALSKVAPATRWGKALAGMGAGASAAGIEGLVYGAGIGETAGERWENAKNQGALGVGIGGILGMASPLLAEGVAAVWKNVKKSDVAEISKKFGISRKAARVIKRHLDVDDFGAAERALKASGGDAMLGEMSPGASSLLDAVAASGGKQSGIVNTAIDGRMTRANSQFKDVADRVLGPPPQGKLTALDAIADRTKGARKAAYDKAYNTPIDYASPKGQEILDLLPRLDQKELSGAIEDVNARLRFKPDGTEQILAKIADDGSVTFEQLPNVAQLDRLKRALQERAQRDMHPLTQRLGNEGQFLSAQANAVRDATRRAVPSYGDAVAIGGNKIAEQNALDIGTKLLRQNVTRDDVLRQMSGASVDERAAAALGFRSAIDEMMARVKAVASDPNVEAREVNKIINELSSRNTQEKARALLGDDAANEILAEADRLSGAFKLRANVSENSRTARRGLIHADVAKEASPNPLQSAASGEPLSSVKGVVSAMTGEGAEAAAARESAIYQDIARFLTEQRGESAKAALKYVEKAIKGQSLTDAEASFVGNIVGMLGFTGGVRPAQQYLAP